MDPQHQDRPRPGSEAAVPFVRTCTHNKSIGSRQGGGTTSQGEVTLCRTCGWIGGL